MDAKIKKIVRTLQSELPFVKEAKVKFYLHARRLLHQPHDADFKAVSFIPPSAQGCYIDVGANQGQSIESILRYKPEGEIVSFEANPQLAQKLGTRYQGRENIRIVPKGLSDKAGRFTLFVPSYKGFVYDALGSLDRDAAASWISDQTVLYFDAAKLSISQVECEVDTLDMQHLAPVFIKLDVEGYEYNVLHGGKETIRQYEPILLVERFRNDPRSVQLAEELGYEEYFFDGTSLRKGSPRKGPNSFLITAKRARTLGE